MSGNKDDLFAIGQGFPDHTHRVGRRTTEIAFGFHLRRRIDVAQNRRPGMLGLERPQLLRRDHIRHGASRLGIRQKNRFLGRQDFRRFGHEVNPAENDDIGVSLRRLHAQSQGISHKIPNILHFRQLVIVDQDDRIALLLEFFDLLNNLHEQPPR